MFKGMKFCKAYPVGRILSRIAIFGQTIKMIIITGAAGFIGSNVLTGLNQRNYKDIVLVDDFSRDQLKPNYVDKEFTAILDRRDLFAWLDQEHRFVQLIIHLGARTDTAEFNWDTFLDLNLEYSKKVWEKCVEYGLPLIYASSAATYGAGEEGYDDEDSKIPLLKPLNPYGRSKNEFDKWVLKQERKPFFWAGLKFFNVYGPNEYHKERMASVVFHAFRQIQKTGSMNLFRSHKEGIKDGMQSRDFIYVKDLVKVIVFLAEKRPESAIYNLGSGKARSFLDLVNATFAALDKEPSIQFIDTPEDIRDKYQYFTEAKMGKLREAGFNEEFTVLEDGVLEYVRGYLLSNSYN